MTKSFVTNCPGDVEMLIQTPRKSGLPCVSGVSAWSWAFTVSGRLRTRDPVTDNVSTDSRG